MQMNADGAKNLAEQPLLVTPFRSASMEVDDHPAGRNDVRLSWRHRLKLAPHTQMEHHTTASENAEEALSKHKVVRGIFSMCSSTLQLISCVNHRSPSHARCKQMIILQFVWHILSYSMGSY